MSYIVGTMSLILWTECFSYTGCDIIHIGAVISLIDLVDDSDTMDMMSNIVGMISSKWWFEVKKLGCDVSYNTHDATHMASVMS